jgi:hypothetical protein
MQELSAHLLLLVADSSEFVLLIVISEDDA